MMTTLGNSHLTCGAGQRFQGSSGNLGLGMPRWFRYVALLALNVVFLAYETSAQKLAGSHVRALKQTLFTPKDGNIYYRQYASQYEKDQAFRDQIVKEMEVWIASTPEQRLQLDNPWDKYERYRKESEAMNREAENREAENREAENREAENREAANREAENREAANREAENRKARNTNRPTSRPYSYGPPSTTSRPYSYRPTSTTSSRYSHGPTSSPYSYGPTSTTSRPYSYRPTSTTSSRYSHGPTSSPYSYGPTSRPYSYGPPSTTSRPYSYRPTSTTSSSYSHGPTSSPYSYGPTSRPDVDRPDTNGARTKRVRRSVGAWDQHPLQPGIVQHPLLKSGIVVQNMATDSISESPSQLSNPVNVHGRIEGLNSAKDLQIFLCTMTGSVIHDMKELRVSATDNRFNFDVQNSGEYYLRIEGSGYFLPGSAKVEIPCKRRDCEFVSKEGVLTVKYVGNDDPTHYNYKWELDDVSKLGRESINIVPEEDISYMKGIEEADEPDKIDSSSASHALNMNYNVKLLGWWGFEYTQQLLNVFESLKFANVGNDKALKDKTGVTKWKLVDEELQNDVKHSSTSDKNDDGNDDGETIIISKNAFRYSRKSAAEAQPEKKSFYFSKRLHQAVIRVLCLNSEDNMKKLFQTRHNIELLNPKHDAAKITELSGYEANEYQSWFQHPIELLELASTWEEYPIGFRSVKNLKYLLRRKDGLVHPKHPTAPAVAWPTTDEDSFIEFMESGFNHYFDIPKLVLHEIAHFIFKTELPKMLQDEFIRMAQWREDPNDPDGWTTDQETTFVTSYSHKKTPMEDFAESLTYYVLNPRKLQSRAEDKYKWIMDNVMEGNRYVTQKTHQFEVLNMGNPDYDYPGRVVQVIVNVYGGSDEAKKAEIEFTLHSVKEAQDCAKVIDFRLYSDVGTYVDAKAYPVTDHCANKLNVKIDILQSWRRGVWTADQLVIQDSNENNRYVGLSGFGLRMWVNNAGEDLTPPQVVPGSIVLRLFGREEAKKITPLAENNRELQVLRITMLSKEDLNMKSVHCEISLDEGRQYAINKSVDKENPEFTGMDKTLFREEAWEGFRKVPIEQCIKRASESEKRGWKCFQVAVNALVPVYKHTGTYRLRSLHLRDFANNFRIQQYPRDERSLSMYIKTSHPDHTPPNIKNVKVTAAPTNPSNPTGETLIDISFEGMDDYSGFEQTSCEIVDPHGSELDVIVAIGENDAMYYAGQWKEYHITHTLPPGSIPGVWALRKIEIYDRAGNRLTHMLTEQIHIVNSF